MDININSEEYTIVELLKKALASEYYAYHMYRSAYHMVKGPRRSTILDELKEHASEELEHADLLEDRIMVLGGTTFHDPTEWDIWNIGEIPSILSSDVPTVLKTIQDSEQQSVSLYRELYDKLAGDPVSQDLILRILQTQQNLRTQELILLRIV
jgi:bacterioferritin